MKRVQMNKNAHLLDFVNNSILGMSRKSMFPLNSLFDGFRAYSIERPFFERIISTICWHPCNREVLLLGSRGGFIKLIKVDSDRYVDDFVIDSTDLCTWTGSGRGHSITGIKWDINDSNWFYTASITGKIMKRNCDASTDICLKDLSGTVELISLHLITGEIVTQTERRFASLDVNCDKKILMAGDNCGSLHLLSTGRENVTKLLTITHNVHSGHILHCEFNPVEPNIVVTASVDRCVKIWDLRMLSGNPKPIFRHEFKYPLNGATFNPSNGTTLVVADNLRQIATFRGPNWEKEFVITHSHQQFQTNSLLKPSFHPSLDLFLMGTSGTDVTPLIDVFSVESGESRFQLSDGKSGVLSINTFNSTGDIIASARRAYLLIWKKDRFLFE